jgi:hypothetical protein
VSSSRNGTDDEITLKHGLEIRRAVVQNHFVELPDPAVAVNLEVGEAAAVKHPARGGILASEQKIGF